MIIGDQHTYLIVNMTKQFSVKRKNKTEFLNVLSSYEFEFDEFEMHALIINCLWLLDPDL